MTFIDYRRQHQAQRDHGHAVRDKIADLVSEGASISAAARSLGISQQAASKHWALIRLNLGEQAR